MEIVPGFAFGADPTVFSDLRTRHTGCERGHVAAIRERTRLTKEGDHMIGMGTVNPFGSSQVYGQVPTSAPFGSPGVANPYAANLYGGQQVQQVFQQVFQLLQFVPQQLQQLQQLEYAQQQQLQQLQHLIQLIPGQLSQLQQLIQIAPHQLQQTQQPSSISQPQFQQPFGHPFGGSSLGGLPTWGIGGQVFGAQPGHVM
jgi:hypothetical protein